MLQSRSAKSPFIQSGNAEVKSNSGNFCFSTALEFVSSQEEISMRYAILAGILAVAFSTAPTFAQGDKGQNEAFCGQMNNEPGAPPRCTYKTMADCKKTVTQAMGTCIENPKMKKK